jgi:CheY-like chemotaxis protein
MVGDREKCLHAGATDYIAKPVNIADLMTMLWRHLQHSSTEEVPRQVG